MMDIPRTERSHLALCPHGGHRAGPARGRGPLLEGAPGHREGTRRAAMIMETGALAGQPGQQPDLVVVIPRQALVPAVSLGVSHQAVPLFVAGCEVADQLPQTGLAQRHSGCRNSHPLNPIVFIEINAGNRTTAREPRPGYRRPAPRVRRPWARIPAARRCAARSPQAMQRGRGRKVVCRGTRLYRRSAGAGAARGANHPGQ
jgi:hypothetical protein